MVDLLESKTNILSEDKSIKIDEISSSLIFMHFLDVCAIIFVCCQMSDLFVEDTTIHMSWIWLLLC
jgi:hypothetical protein